jgi:F-type H+-transporting ATPase subunit epsilon
MAEGALHVDIISPERPLYSGNAASVVAPAHDGEVGILPHHAPMVAQLGTGEVKITRADGGHDYFAVYKGFLQTAANKVIIVSEDACAPDDVNDAEVAHDIASVNQRIHAGVTTAERAKLNDELKWFHALEKLARHRKSGK